MRMPFDQTRLLSRLFHFFPFSHYVLLALLFFIGLELLSSSQRFLLWLTAAFLAVVVTGIVLVGIEEKGYFHPTQTILPALAAIGLTGFALFLPTTALIHLYFLASALIFFFLLKHGSRQAYPTWNWVISAVVYFLSIASILAWRFHLYVPVLLVLTLSLLITFLISWQALLRVVPSTRSATLVALTMGFVLSEITWALLFLPLHYAVQAGVVLIFYYVFFHLLSISYERALARRDILEYGSIGLVALALILITARWT